MTLSDECKAILKRHRLDLDLYAQNKVVRDLIELVERKTELARAEGYEAGRWDRAVRPS
jgi:hypothetical protein